MKEIKLIADAPFHNSVDVSVLDFPNGNDGEPRKRCKITVEFSQYDVNELKKRGLDFERAMEYYKDWIYNVVKFHIAQDWTCIGGLDKLMEIINEKVKAYYQD